MKTIKYSETFFSAQGEGHYVGVPSLWMRFYMCNLQCNGFGQDNPTDESSWELPYETIDISDIDRVEDLPVFDKGCDSSYTWAKRYRHLMTDRSAQEAVDELTPLLPGGKFKHPKTGLNNHMVFTGGEPMMPGSQKSMIEVMTEFHTRANLPKFVTVETNGTRPLTPTMQEYIKHYTTVLGGEWFWSVSPKLWNTAGEESKRAIKPEVVAEYAKLTGTGQLKFVVNGTKESWDEMEQHIAAFREAGCDFPVWVMGVGGTFEGLVVTEADIADEAIQRGYNYTSRVHVHIYGNAIGK